MYKRFQKFSIKTLIRIAYPNFKNEQKIGPNTLGVNTYYTCNQLFLLLKVEMEINGHLLGTSCS